MALEKSAFSKYIREFKFKELFNELGWDYVNKKVPVNVGEATYMLNAIVEKKGFVIFLCSPDGAGGIPDSSERKKIDNVIAKLYFEHLIIYIDGKTTRQHWELVIREQNKPLVSRPIDYYAGQEPEILFQKLEGLFFTFEDEDKLSIVDVRSRVIENFERNAEVVTKKFYERFEKEHEKFLGFIEGIEKKVDQEWYASLMLNRLMFIYFIQKKGFLDRNLNYLSDKLSMVKEKKGRNKFYSFYKDFLLVLFHQGLGAPHHDAELKKEIGNVPYLNGGLFDVHQLEKENHKITIEDKAFERIFSFFNEFNWHLDTSISATGKDINPDVIGYIFEKYINDRAAMGAYYTKEDITEYISKNCIVPWLFDEVKRNYAKPFSQKESESIWSFLQQSGDRYIYPAVKYGINSALPEKKGFSDLPDDVQAGLPPDTPDLVEKRKCWNKPAPSTIALPTEIYREVIARRKRYYEVRAKIEKGEIADINDLITYNLDIRQFAQDILSKTDDPELLKQFYKALRKITVLDPTCGSGAFLFAALNILEPLYFACVTRMRELVQEAPKGKHKFFEDELKFIDLPEHPSTEYFIYKTIILHNLYGVDLMKEAVEIAKLRLFLKLVATVDVDYTKSNLGLEPLPDIDFNIRSGNTLVGFATLADLNKGGQGGLFGDDEKKAIIDQADVVSRAYERFKDAQLVMHTDPKHYKDAKKTLNERLADLNVRLNKYLAVSYHKTTPTEKGYKQWLDSHQPFHWLAEFYDIIEKGGFDVIIGNPPYVVYRNVRDDYKIKDYQTEECSDLYAFVMERSLSVQSKMGRCGFIVPVSFVSTDGFSTLRELVKDVCMYNWYSTYAMRPAKLFDGAEKHLCIWIALKTRSNENSVCFSTRYHRWSMEERGKLFPLLNYVAVPEDVMLMNSIPKIGSELERSILINLIKQNKTLGSQCINNSKYVVYHTRKLRYFVQFLDGAPKMIEEGGIERVTSELKEVPFDTELKRDAVLSVYNSTLFFWFFLTFSDCRNVNHREVHSFRFDISSAKPNVLNSLGHLSKKLMKDLQDNSEMREMDYVKYGKLNVQVFAPRLSKPIIDKIDDVLSKHYGFTDEELDFIINYDIKYRMGKELGEEE